MSPITIKTRAWCSIVIFKQIGQAKISTVVLANRAERVQILPKVRSEQECKAAVAVTEGTRSVLDNFLLSTQSHFAPFGYPIILSSATCMPPEW